MDAIMHLASPVHLTATEPSEMIGPAVKGVTVLVNSVLAHGPSVKRIVLTSSCGAVAPVTSTPGVYDEHDWNDAAVKECEEKGKDSPWVFMYCASKVLAERAAWDLYEKHGKASGSWDLVSIMPPYILGPPLNAVPNREALGASMQQWYGKVFVKGKDESDDISDG